MAVSPAMASKTPTMPIMTAAKSTHPTQAVGSRVLVTTMMSPLWDVLMLPFENRAFPGGRRHPRWVVEASVRPCQRAAAVVPGMGAGWLAAAAAVAVAVAVAGAGRAGALAR